MAYTYQFQRAPDVAGSPGSWSNIGSATTSTTYNDTGLNVNTPYHYRCIVTDSIPNTATSGQVATRTLAIGTRRPGMIRTGSRSGHVGSPALLNAL